MSKIPEEAEPFMNIKVRVGVVALAYNPSYLGGRG
jgi:hypothetical protein